MYREVKWPADVTHSKLMKLGFQFSCYLHLKYKEKTPSNSYNDQPLHITVCVYVKHYFECFTYHFIFLYSSPMRLALLLNNLTSLKSE